MAVTTSGGYDALPVQIVYPESQEFASKNLQKWESPAVDSHFIAGLNRIGGRDRFGDPRLRVVWMQDRFRIAFGQRWAKYLCQRVETVDGFYDIGIPRFCIEEKVDPIWLMRGWNETIQGPRPTRGDYNFMMCLQDEQGNFSYPTDRFLRIIERAHYRRMAERLFTSHEEADPDYVRQWKMQELKDMYSIGKAKQDAERKAMIRDHFKQDLNRITAVNPGEGMHIDKYRNSRAFQDVQEKRIITV